MTVQDRSAVVVPQRKHSSCAHVDEVRGPFNNGCEQMMTRPPSAVQICVECRSHSPSRLTRTVLPSHVRPDRQFSSSSRDRRIDDLALWRTQYHRRKVAHTLRHNIPAPLTAAGVDGATSSSTHAHPTPSRDERRSSPVRVEVQRVDPRSVRREREQPPRPSARPVFAASIPVPLPRRWRRGSSQTRGEQDVDARVLQGHEDVVAPRQIPEHKIARRAVLPGSDQADQTPRRTPRTSPPCGRA